jgi:hypothetical protein
MSQKREDRCALFTPRKKNASGERLTDSRSGSDEFIIETAKFSMGE